MQTAIRIDSSHPVVSRLMELQGSETDRAFSSAHLTVSETVWYRIRTGKYQAEDHSRVLRKLTNDLSSILDHAAITGAIKSAKILPLSHITESRDALNMAFSEERNRIVIALADTGGGKSAIAKSIARDFATRTVLVEATESWRKSYIGAIHAIGRALGIADQFRNNSRIDEQILLDYLAANPRIIVIDEGNYFGSAALNLVKAICNQTSCIVFILAMPVLWKFITRSSQQEARQVRNRAAAILEFTSLKRKDVAVALADTVPNWESLAELQGFAVNSVKDAANSFGLWNTVFTIARFIADEAASGSLTLDIVERAVADVVKLRK